MQRLLIQTLTLLCGALLAASAQAFDPLTLGLGKGVATALDARTMSDVQADVAIDAALTKKLLEHKGEDFKHVSLLVFARHAVLVGFAGSEAVKDEAERLARADKRLRSLKNDIVIGPARGSLGHDLLLDKKIDLALTAARGVHSVNLRWKVYGGDVFLMGLAHSSAEADQAVRTVQGLGGVKTVHASLRVGRK